MILGLLISLASATELVTLEESSDLKQIHDQALRTELYKNYKEKLLSEPLQVIGVPK